HAHRQARTLTLTHADTHAHRRARTQTRTHTDTHAHRHARTQTRTHTHTHAQTHTRTHTHTHRHTHTHTHRDTHPEDQNKPLVELVRLLHLSGPIGFSAGEVSLPLESAWSVKDKRSTWVFIVSVMAGEGDKP